MKNIVLKFFYILVLLCGSMAIVPVNADPIADRNGKYGEFQKHSRVKQFNHSLKTEKGPSSRVREGLLSQRFEVRSGDCGRNDCRSDRERFELWDKSGIKPGTETWASYSLRLDKKFPYIRPTNTTLGQFKQEPQGFEVVGIGIENDKLFFYNKLRLKDGDVRYNIDRPFMSLEKARGNWIDVLVHTNWRSDETGFMEVFINGRQIADFKGPVIYNMKDRITFRYGIYRSFVSRYVKENGKKVPTMVVHYDNVRWDSSREAVELPR